MVGPGETEKVTINLGPVDLGQIDLLVQEGFYSNRTDFIGTAIRNQLAQHAEAVRSSVARKTWRSVYSTTRARIWRRYEPDHHSYRPPTSSQS